MRAAARLLKFYQRSGLRELVRRTRGAARAGPAGRRGDGAAHLRPVFRSARSALRAARSRARDGVRARRLHHARRVRELERGDGPRAQRRRRRSDRPARPRLLRRDRDPRGRDAARPRARQAQHRSVRAQRRRRLRRQRGRLRFGAQRVWRSCSATIPSGTNRAVAFSAQCPRRPRVPRRDRACRPARSAAARRRDLSGCVPPGPRAAHHRRAPPAAGVDPRHSSCARWTSRRCAAAAPGSTT